MVDKTKGTKDNEIRDEEGVMAWDDLEYEPTTASKAKTKKKAKIAPYRLSEDESYMNEAQLEHFANLLEAWKHDLMEEVDHTITEMKEATALADQNDRATQEEISMLELKKRDRERKLIKKIEEALSQIQDKEYGYCEACGVEIGVRRLEARPTATLCIDCKTLAEIQEKRA